jgi:SAM-dependent methyltransferase
MKRPCPICQSYQSKAIRKLDLIVPDGFSLQHTFSINACCDCGGVFHNVEPQKNRDSYYESYTGSTTDEYQISNEQIKLNDLTINFLEHAGVTSTNQSIVDVGCSFGIALMTLKKKGFENVYAIDPDRAAIRYLKHRGISGKVGLASDAFPEFNQQFDIVILRHVLEHLYSPIDAINNVAKWLKPNGKLYIELPDLSRYSESAPFPGYFFEYEHINHFSLLSLLNLMSEFSLTHYESTIDIYPCLRAVFVKKDFSKLKHHAIQDVKYVEDSFSLASEQGQIVLDNIERLGQNEIALWGVSTFVYRLLTHTALKNCNIQYLVDGNPSLQGETVLGLVIQSPEALSSFSGDIIICGKNSAASICNAIKELGLNNNIVHLMKPAVDLNLGD